MIESFVSLQKLTIAVLNFIKNMHENHFQCGFFACLTTLRGIGIPKVFQRKFLKHDFSFESETTLKRKYLKLFTQLSH